MSTGLDHEPSAPETPMTSDPVDPRPGRPWATAPRQPRPDSLGLRVQRAGVAVLRKMPKALVRVAASDYIAGETRAQALVKADILARDKGLHSTLDVLGEDVTCLADIEDYLGEFQKLVDDMEARPHANVSVKLSALGQETDEEACYERTRGLVRQARDRGTFVRLDMEDHTTIDSTLRIYRRLREEGLDNTGVVLQSRLFRTKADVEALAPLKPNVRLCIGIYREPADIALQDKDAMKRHLLELLEMMWANGQHVGIATHEEWVIRGALDLAQRMGKPDREIEVQMLLGVPRDKLQQELIARGIRVRLYVPYGERWHAYSMRRLENNPGMMGMIAGNLFGKLLGRK